MQLGTRWSFGATPPPRLSERMVAAIRRVESAVAGNTANLRWTLTWLETHPIAELDPSTSSGTVTIVREGYDGSVAITDENGNPL